MPFKLPHVLTWGAISLVEKLELYNVFRDNGDVLIRIQAVLHYVTTVSCIRPRDTIDHVTIRLCMDDFLYVLNRNQTLISLS